MASWFSNSTGDSESAMQYERISRDPKGCRVLSHVLNNLLGTFAKTFLDKSMVRGSYLLSAQKELLSNSGITSVTFIQYAIATMSQICNKEARCHRHPLSEFQTLQL